MKVSVTFDTKDEFKTLAQNILGDNEILWNERSNFGEIILVMDDNFPRERNVRFIQTITAGTDHIDLSNIPESTIVASNAGAYSISVAEHAFALLLERAKKICEKNLETKRGVYNQIQTTLLYGKTVGIIGYGGIGSRFAKIAKSFDMNVIAIGRTYRDSNAEEFYGLDSLDKVMSKSDYILISIPVTTKTNGLLDKRELNLLKRDAVVINVARPEIVKKGDMLEFLKERKDISYLTDVWWNEPDLSGSELENIVVTPHEAGGRSGEVMEFAFRYAFENILNFIEKKKVTGVVRRDEHQKVDRRNLMV